MSMLSARDPDPGAGARQPGRASKPLRPRPGLLRQVSFLLYAPPCSRRPRHGGHSLGHAPYRQPKHDEHGEHGAPDEARDHGARRAVRTVVVEHRSTPTRLAAATCSGSKRESERASRVTRRASKGPFLKTTVVARLRQVLGLTLVKHVTRASRLHPLLAEASRRRARTGALRTYRSSDTNSADGALECWRYACLGLQGRTSEGCGTGTAPIALPRDCRIGVTSMARGVALNYVLARHDRELRC